MTMKKLSLVILAGLLLGNAPAMSTPPELGLSLEKVVGKEHAHNLKFHRDEASAPYGFWTEKSLIGSLVGGAIGLGYSFVAGVGYMDNGFGGAALGAALTVCYSFATVQERVKVPRERIEIVLQEYTTHKDLKSLPEFESLMVLAAYLKDIELMKKLTPHVAPFLEEIGVWQALVELYYDASEKEIDKELKAKDEKQSMFSNKPTPIEAVQQAKEKLKEFTPMEQKLLQRRVELLKEKIGYNDL